MFANTLTLTVNAVAKVLQRVNQDAYGSEYSFQSGTESIIMKIRHSADAVDKDGLLMKRHNVFVEHIVFPTLTDRMKKFTATVTLRHGSFNDPVACADLFQALAVLLATGTMVDDLTVGVN